MTELTLHVGRHALPVPVVFPYYAAFLDEHLLWLRNTSLFQLDQLDSMSAQMGRVLSPAGWRQVAQTIAYQATHTPV